MTRNSPKGTGSPRAETAPSNPAAGLFGRKTIRASKDESQPSQEESNWQLA